MFSFTLSWNAFIHALAFIQSSERKTVPVAILTELVTGDVDQWGALMAGSLLGSLLGSLPGAIFHACFVDHDVSSLTGAVKERPHDNSARTRAPRPQRGPRPMARAKGAARPPGA